MKNKILYTGLFLVSILAFIGCEQDRTFPEFENLEHGAYPRRLGSITGTYSPNFNYNDVAGSSLGFSVEFYDDNNGQNVESYSWTVNHAPTGTSATILTINKSQFGTSPDGLPSADFTFTFQGALDALGLTIDDVNGGESIQFYATLTMNDGRVFNHVNTSDILEGQPAYRALFQHRASIICPSELAGEFDATTVGKGTWAGSACSGMWTGKVTWVHEGNGVYNVKSFYNDEEFTDMSMGGYNACYYPAGAPQSGLPNGTLRINDACGKLFYSGLSQWGETYVFNSITVNGNSLVIDWENDYGETALTTLVRTDGKNWPANLRK
jgi:hypothetical protein